MNNYDTNNFCLLRINKSFFCTRLCSDRVRIKEKDNSLWQFVFSWDTDDEFEQQQQQQKKDIQRTLKF